jgi:hypothetical protein
MAGRHSVLDAIGVSGCIRRPDRGTSWSCLPAATGHKRAREKNREADDLLQRWPEGLHRMEVFTVLTTVRDGSVSTLQVGFD